MEDDTVHASKPKGKGKAKSKKATRPTVVSEELAAGESRSRQALPSDAVLSISITGRPTTPRSITLPWVCNLPWTDFINGLISLQCCIRSTSLSTSGTTTGKSLGLTRPGPLHVHNTKRVTPTELISYPRMLKSPRKNLIR